MNAVKNDNLQLAGKKALVTGASSGLGLHFARVLARHGAHVVMAARREEVLRTLAEDMEAPAGVSIAGLDVTDGASRAAIAQSVGAVDILVNNAGLVRESGCCRLSTGIATRTGSAGCAFSAGAGRLAIQRYFERALSTLPAAARISLQHTVGSDRGRRVRMERRRLVLGVHLRY